ncbi:MAG: dipeptidase [Candidatus Thorarchaeota archaeon]
MCLRGIDTNHFMQFADAHSDLGILMFMVEVRAAPRHLVEDFMKGLEMAEVGLSVVQIGGDFGQAEYDFRDRDTVLQTMSLFQSKSIKKYPFMEVAVSRQDVENIAKRGKSAVILSIEGSAAIDIEFETLDFLYSQGLRSLAITHDGQNQYGSGCRVEDDTGLTQDGVRLLDYAAKKGMILDLVHVGEKTFWGAIEHATQPVFVSHSNSKSVYNNVRNITDQQIQAIGERDGVVAVNFISVFLDSQQGVTLDRLVDHIDRIVELTSIENIALGPDFYQYLMPEINNVGDVGGPADIVRVPPALEKRGYSEKDISKICHENLVRFMSSSL